MRRHAIGPPRRHPPDERHAIGVQSEAIRGQDRPPVSPIQRSGGQSACNHHAISMQSACNQHAIRPTCAFSPKVWRAINMQSPCNQHALSGNQTHLCLLSEGLQQIIGAHASRCGDDRARPDHRGATAAAAAAIVPQLPLALIFETLRRCVHGACMHVVVGRPSVAISMRRCVHGACMHVVVGRQSVAISMHSVAISMQSVAISNHLHARGRWDPLCSSQHAISRNQQSPACTW